MDEKIEETITNNEIKLKKVDGKIEASVDGRKTISPFNSAKHLKFAKKGISAFCNTCKYRSVNAGGRGGCPVYQPDSVCLIRKDTKKLCAELDTRNPDTIEYMLDYVIKEGFENVVLAYAQSKIDGNVPDKNTRAEIDSFVKRLQLWNELRSKTTVRAVKAELGTKEDMTQIFQMLEATKKGTLSNDSR